MNATGPALGSQLTRNVQGGLLGALSRPEDGSALLNQRTLEAFLLLTRMVPRAPGPLEADQGQSWEAETSALPHSLGMGGRLPSLPIPFLQAPSSLSQSLYQTLGLLTNILALESLNTDVFV